VKLLFNDLLVLDALRDGQSAGQKWTVTSIMADDLLALPEISIEIPAVELYEGIEFSTSGAGGMPAEQLTSRGGLPHHRATRIEAANTVVTRL
jgi:hypothetical protein